MIRTISFFLLFIPVAAAFSQFQRDQVVSAYEKFHSTGIRPEIHLVLSQPVFSPGDTIFYNIFLLDQHQVPVAGKNLFRTHIVGFQNEVVTTTITKVIDGLGSSYLALPESIPAGLYMIIVESPWLSNATPSAVYQREITIVRERVIRRHEIKAFAEGGNFIRSFHNKIVFQGPENALIQIENYKRQTIDSCVTDRYGLGHVIIDPVDDDTLFAFVRSMGLRIAIPVSDGKYGLRLHKPQGQFIMADLKSDEMDRTKLLAVVTSQGRIRYDTTIEVARGTNTLPIPVEKLAGGLNTLSLLNEDGRVMAYRNFYHQAMALSKTDIIATQFEYGPRQKVQLDVTLKDQSGQPIESEFIFWALNGNILTPEEIVFSLSELNIPLSELDSTILGTHPRLFLESLDDYCVTQVGVDWQTILKAHQPFSNSQLSVFYRRGKVYVNGSGDPAPDNTQVLIYFLNTGLHYQTFTLNGMVQVTVPEFYGEDEVFYMAEHPDGTLAATVRIEWEKARYDFLPPPPSGERAQPDRYGQFASKRRSINQSFQFFSSIKKSSDFRPASVEKETVFNFEDKVGGVDVVVNLKDYQRFSTLPEVIKEIIPALKFRIRKDRPSVRVDLQAAIVPKEDPLFFIDGVPTLSTELFLNLQPDDIESIQLIRSGSKLGKLGLMGKNGVVIVRTNKGELRNQLKSGLVKIIGINPAPSQPVVDISGISASYPVFKSTLCWMPGLKTDAQGKASTTFYTTDDVGPMFLFLVGIGKNGKVVFAGKKLIVSDDD